MATNYWSINMKNFTVERMENRGKEVKVQPGDNATLQCYGPKDAAIKRLEWSRLDLKSQRCVLFKFRGQDLSGECQHPFFVNRVELRDPEMKEGDASVILKNVNVNDTGRYQCWIIAEKVRLQKRATDLKHVISLKVEDTTGQSRNEGNKDGVNRSGHIGLVAALSLLLQWL